MINTKVVSLLFCIILSSCATQKRCFEKFNIDTVFVKNVVYRDTVISVPVLGTAPFLGKMPLNLIKPNIPVRIPQKQTNNVKKTYISKDTLFVNNGTAHGKAWINNDTLNLFVWQSDTTLQVKLDSALKQISIRESQIITIKEKTKLKTYLNYILTFGVIALLIVLIPRVLKKK